jgi:hypothetical protein
MFYQGASNHREVVVMTDAGILFYTLEALATKWGCDEIVLLQWAYRGFLKMGAYIDIWSSGLGGRLEGFAIIDSTEFYKFFYGHEKVTIESWKMEGSGCYQGLGMNRLTLPCGGPEGDNPLISQGPKVSRDELKVSVEEVARFKVDHRNLLFGPSSTEDKRDILHEGPAAIAKAFNKIPGITCSRQTIINNAKAGMPHHKKPYGKTSETSILDKKQEAEAIAWIKRERPRQYTDPYSK